MYGLLNARVVQDLHLTQLVFDVAGLDSKTEAVALLEMLDQIHAVRCPASVTKADET